MKLFGNSRNENELDQTMKLPAARENERKKSNTSKKPVQKTNENYAKMKNNPKKQGKKKKHLTRKQKVQRGILIFLILLAVCLGAAAFWVHTVRAPDIANKPKTELPKDASSAQELVEIGDRISDYFTFIVGAVDKDHTRTDTLMVVGFDAKDKKINVLNIPRDTMTTSGRNGTSRKINASYGTKGGIETTKSDLKDIIGFVPDYHIIVNFQGIADIVDAIGGVDYEIPFRMYYKDPSQDLSIDFKPGMKHLNGQETVEFLRWRKNNGGVRTGDSGYTGSDEQRIEKQQKFLKYLASQVLSPSNASKIPAIAKAVFTNVKTDFTVGEMIWMATQASGVSTENLNMFTLPGYSAYSYAGTSTYLSFYFPNETKTLALVNESFNPYTLPITNIDVVSGPTKKSSSVSSHKEQEEEEEQESDIEGTETSRDEETAEKIEAKEEAANQENHTDPENGKAESTESTKPSEESNVEESPAEPSDSTDSSTTKPTENSETTSESTPPAGTTVEPKVSIDPEA